MSNHAVIAIDHGRRGLVLVAALAGCGRTGLPPDRCTVAYSPASLDFGDVAPGSTEAASVTVENRGVEVCALSDIGLSPDTSDGFALVGQPASLSLRPGQRASLEVTFAPADVVVPLSRTGALTFVVDDPSRPAVRVPLAARIHSGCMLAITPAAVDFGHVALGGSAMHTVTVANIGTGPCAIADVTLGSGSDAEFFFAADAALSMLAPGASASIDVGFAATDPAAPHHRTGTLTFQSTDPNLTDATVPLAADIDIGCDLTLTPPSVSFGNVVLNTTAHSSVALGNDGSAPCNVSGLALGAGSDPEFALAAGQATSFTVPPGGSQSIPLSFTASDSAPPHLKTGTLILHTGNPRAPDATVPLSANVDTVCVEASQWIYTVDQDTRFSRFDPATLTFTDLGRLDCPDGSGPNSMAVDQNAVAWVAYTDGQLFQVDTGSAACTPTSFQPNQDGLLQFGMGFVFDPSTGLDTLYIAGGASSVGSQSTLATISFPSLTVTPIGITAGEPELTGTGDGTLWGFFPNTASATGIATLVQIDPTSGATLASFQYPTLTGGSAWAMKFWGGSFWIFLDQSIFRVDRAAPRSITTVVAQTGRTIVGAGVSSCAPLH